MKKPKSVNEYIAVAPKEARRKLKELRVLVKESAPKAEEGMSYGMPYYKYKGRLLYFAGFRDHVSLFPANSETIRRFKNELKSYKTSVGTVQFPLGSRLPRALITKLVKARVKQNEERFKSKK